MTAPSLWRRIRNTLTNSRHRRMATIDIDADGFVFTWKKRARRVRWDAIDRIDAGMRDFLNVDRLYVVIFAGALRLEIDELDDGFRQFENEILARWPQIRETWNKLLAADPHEPQHETLWRR